MDTESREQRRCRLLEESFPGGEEKQIHLKSEFKKKKRERKKKKS